MGKKNSHIDQKAEAVNVAPTLARTNHVNNAPNNDTNTDSLNGLEDIAQLDSAGVPFFLVGGVCCRTRQQLQAALSKQEKKRMKWVQQQCCVLPWLEHTSLPRKLDHSTESEEAARHELEFQKDLQLLTLSAIEEEETQTGSITPIAHVASDEKLVPQVSRIDEIRLQLEKLREKQQQTNKTPVAEQPRLVRQGTFDIKRGEKIQMGKDRAGKSQPSEDQKSTQKSPIVNQIGDLIMQLPYQKEERQLNSGPISYLVTISPAIGHTNCTIEPLPSPIKAELTAPEFTRCATEVITKSVPVQPALPPKSRTFLKMPRMLKK